FVDPPPSIKIFEIIVTADVVEQHAAVGGSQPPTPAQLHLRGMASNFLEQLTTRQTMATPSSLSGTEIAPFLVEFERRITATLTAFEQRIDSKLAELEDRLETTMRRVLLEHDSTTSARASSSSRYFPTAPAGDAYVDFRTSKADPRSDPRYLAYKAHAKEYNDLSFS
ncbi:hypothetical protein HDU93_010062, partial [Gonapodya sp. JEL0774]